MRKKINLIFALFDRNNIRYYLLRPLDFRSEIKDIDLIIVESEYSNLKKILTKEFGQLYYKPSNANASTQLLVDGLLLDLKFSICFLPRKSLVLNYDIPFSSVIYKIDYLLVPNVEEEKLFTFWTHHMFLDKQKPADSSTFLVFKDLYVNSFSELLNSEFFKDSLLRIFPSDKNIQAAKLISSYFNNGLNPNEIKIGEVLKNIVIRNSIGFQLKYIYDKVKFGIYRRIGLYENYRAVK